MAICSFWRPGRICSDLYSPYLEVHVRLFCKNSPEHTAKIKVKRQQGSDLYVCPGRLGEDVGERMLPSRKTETAVLRSRGSRSPAVTCSGTEPVDVVSTRLLGCRIRRAQSSRDRGAWGAWGVGSGSIKGAGMVEEGMSAN